jgi:uncharacterized membrane protein YbhN (UPF0104 family)
MKRDARITILVLLLACAALGAWGVVRASRSGVDSLFARDVRWEIATLCMCTMMLLAILYAFSWSMLLSALERRAVPRAAAMRLFLVTWPGRYVPASLPYYGARIAAGPSIGVRRSVIAASFVYENLFAIASSGGVAVILLLIISRGRIGGGPWVVAAVAAAIACVSMLHPAVPRGLIRFGARRIRRLAPVESHLVPASALTRIAITYVGSACLVGTSFWLATVALGADVSLLTAIAAYNLAGVAGMLAIAVPGGVGVREGVVVALLSATVSPPVALAAAVLARLAGVIADLIPFCAIVLYDAWRRTMGARRPVAAEAQPALREAA